MIAAKAGYDIKKYEVKNFLSEGMRKIKRQIVNVNSEMAMDSYDEVYTEEEQNFMAMQVTKFKIIEMLLETDDKERIIFLHNFLNAYLKDKKSNTKQNTNERGKSYD